MTKHDPEQYERMSVPHDSAEDATEFLETFQELVATARRECRIQNVLVIAQARYAVEGQDAPADTVVTYMLGDEHRTALYLAMAYGAERKRLLERREHLDAALRVLDEYARGHEFAGESSDDA